MRNINSVKCVQTHPWLCMWHQAILYVKGVHVFEALLSSYSWWHAQTDRKRNPRSCGVIELITGIQVQHSAPPVALQLRNPARFVAFKCRAMLGDLWSGWGRFVLRQEFEERENGSEAVNIGVRAGIGGSLSQQRKLRKIEAPRALSRFLLLFNMNAHNNAYEIQTKGFKIIMPWKRHNVSRYKSWVIYIKFSQYQYSYFTGD